MTLYISLIEQTTFEKNNEVFQLCCSIYVFTVEFAKHDLFHAQDYDQLYILSNLLEQAHFAPI